MPCFSGNHNRAQCLESCCFNGHEIRFRDVILGECVRMLRKNDRLLFPGLLLNLILSFIIIYWIKMFLLIIMDFSYFFSAISIFDIFYFCTAFFCFNFFLAPFRYLTLFSLNFLAIMNFDPPLTIYLENVFCAKFSDILDFFGHFIRHPVIF